jgi:hypothetical protein
MIASDIAITRGPSLTGKVTMQISGTDTDGFVVQLTRTELDIVTNCLNEVANGIDVFEFETRIGATKEDVRQLLSQIP